LFVIENDEIFNIFEMSLSERRFYDWLANE